MVWRRQPLSVGPGNAPQRAAPRTRPGRPPLFSPPPTVQQHDAAVGRGLEVRGHAGVVQADGFGVKVTAGGRF